MPDIWLDVDTAVKVSVNKLPLMSNSDFITRDETIAFNESGMDLVWNFITTAGVFTQTAVTPTAAGDYDWSHIGNAMYDIEIPASGGVSINNDTEGFGWFSGLVDNVLDWISPIYGFRAASLNNGLVDGANAPAIAGDLMGLADDAITPAKYNDAAAIIPYMGGIWVDSGAGNANTVVGVDGLPSNPVSSLVAARTLAVAIGLQKYYIISGSSLTLAATHQWWEFVGIGRSGNIINLGSQDIDGSVFTNLSLAGTQGGASFVKLKDSVLTSLVSLRPQAVNCKIAGDITILTGTMISFEDCKSGVPGDTAPALTFTAGATTLQFRNYSGGLEIKSMTSDHTMSYESDGQIIINANCTSGNITLRGMMSITDNGTTMNITKDAVFNKQEARDAMKVAPTAGSPAAGSVDKHLDDIEADTNELQTDWANGGRLDLLLDAIKAVTDFLVVKKNTAKNNFKFPMVLASDHVSDANNLTVTCQRSIDVGAFANCTNTPATFISAGTYKINLSAADLNGDVIMLKFTAATADARKMLILTVP